MANLRDTDVVDEDAADLQFPKDMVDRNDSEYKALPTLLCYTCGNVLKEPFIQCAECSDVNICTACFSSGAELNSHLNSHNYMVVKNEFSLFEGSLWSAKEEMALLDAIQDCGLGNWDDIAHHVKTRSSEDCEGHYMQWYVDNHSLPDLPMFKKSDYLKRNPPMPYFGSKGCDIDEPPRYSVDSPGYKSLAGYNAGRSEFDIEHDQYAENDICELRWDTFSEKDDYHELGQALQVALVSKYNERLKERHRRKKVIRDHGLIVMRKATAWQIHYEQALNRRVVEKLIPFAQLLSGMDLDYLMESLKHGAELRQRILRLCELRENGLTNFFSCKVYYKLLNNRNDYLKDRKLFTANPEYNWRNSLGNSLNSTPTGYIPRRPAPPLDIVGLPMYERLNPAERQLCSTTRIIPESYLMFKNILITEYKRNGSLKLAQARSLIKIDVNKTRKLYDFLLKESLISQ